MGSATKSNRDRDAKRAASSTKTGLNFLKTERGAASGASKGEAVKTVSVA
jgi:hypothetical protein